MNPIKFRVWDLEKKRWHIAHWENDLDMPVITPTGSLRFVEGSPTKEFRRVYSRTGFIVQLFTGASDKNGKEIFIGDLIEVPSFMGRTYLEEVKFEYDIEGSCGSSVFGYGFNPKTARIVGNICENPEMLDAER